MTGEKPTSGATLSDDQVVQLGHQASQAFQNPVFRVAFQSLQGELYQRWLGAPAEHTKEMAALKADHTALIRLEQRLVGLIQHAETVIRRRNQQADPEYRKQQELDNQGFGLDFAQEGGQ